MQTRKEKKKNRVVDELAKELGITQQGVSVMIDNLKKSGAIDIWYRGKIENSPCWYNVYRLNY